jgi:ATP-dependent Clp protease ATP-binding subunit ClpA
MKSLRPLLDADRMGREASELHEHLRSRIVGQEDAVRQIVHAYQMHLTGMVQHGRPVANLLFLGPTGSGKTRVVEATAEGLLGSPRALLKVDCGEFQHSHEIAKLVGSPPGYLGHRETHPMLCQDALNQFHTQRTKLSLLLFDEIEKASDALWNLLLGILDKATLTLGDGRSVDFSSCMIVMTSNLGAEAMSTLLSPPLGFFAGSAPESTSAAVASKLTEAGIQAARRKFTPEFVNRLDRIIVFHALGEEELRRVLDLELRLVQERVFRRSEIGPFVFTLSDSAKEHILAEGADPRYGARHLKRAVERIVVQPLSNLMASGQVRAGDWIRVEREAGRMTFTREAEGMTAYAMADLARTGPASAAAAAA